MRPAILWTLARFEIRQTLAARRAPWMALLAAAPAGLCALAGDVGRDAEETALLFYYLFAGAVCPLLSLFHSGTMLQGELEGKTLACLWVRPVRRAVVVLGRFLGSWAALSLLVSLGVAFAWLAAGKPIGGALLCGALAAAVASLAGYGAVALAIGALFPRRAFMSGLASFLLLETGLSHAPFASAITLAPTLRRLLTAALPPGTIRDPDILRSISDVGAFQAWGIVAAVSVTGMILAGLAVSRREYAAAED